MKRHLLPNLFKLVRGEVVHGALRNVIVTPLVEPEIRRYIQAIAMSVTSYTPHQSLHPGRSLDGQLVKIK